MEQAGGVADVGPKFGIVGWNEEETGERVAGVVGESAGGLTAGLRIDGVVCLGEGQVREDEELAGDVADNPVAEVCGYVASGGLYDEALRGDDGVEVVSVFFPDCVDVFLGEPDGGDGDGFFAVWLHGGVIPGRSRRCQRFRG